MNVEKNLEKLEGITEVIANETIFEFDDVSGTVAGYRFPESFEGVNVAGYHLHFITDDHSAGGYVLNFTMVSGTIEIDYIHNIEIDLLEVFDSSVVSGAFKC
jgi:acetolactate decarboxylase